jgi:hypothetical protein
LLEVTKEDDILLSKAIDVVNGDIKHSQHMFKNHTNLPAEVRLQPGARVD